MRAVEDARPYDTDPHRIEPVGKAIGHPRTGNARPYKFRPTL